MPLAFFWFYKHKMAETKITKKKCFFSFVNNSHSYRQNSTKFHAIVEYTYWNNILKFFLILWISTIFPPTVPFDPVSRYTPVSPTGFWALVAFLMTECVSLDNQQSYKAGVVWAKDRVNLSDNYQGPLEWYRKTMKRLFSTKNLPKYSTKGWYTIADSILTKDVMPRRQPRLLRDGRRQGRHALTSRPDATTGTTLTSPLQSNPRRHAGEAASQHSQTWDGLPRNPETTCPANPFWPATPSRSGWPRHPEITQ
jgi:hypothetical protein